MAREHVVSVRLDADQYVFLSDRARETGCKLSDLVRSYLRRPAPAPLPVSPSSFTFNSAASRTVVVWPDGTVGNTFQL